VLLKAQVLLLCVDNFADGERAAVDGVATLLVDAHLMGEQGKSRGDSKMHWMRHN
jgi:hypothetical protein